MRRQLRAKLQSETICSLRQLCYVPDGCCSSLWRASSWSFLVLFVGRADPVCSQTEVSPLKISSISLHMGDRFHARLDAEKILAP